jgi:hypothetical protein
VDLPVLSDGRAEELMVTLSKRATPSQDRMLRIIEGAVLNAFDSKGIPRNPVFARSIAKRAAGTLSAQWPEVLSANTTPTEGHPVNHATGAQERRVTSRPRRERVTANDGETGAQIVSAPARRGSSQVIRRSPLLALRRQLAMEMWQIRRDGDDGWIDAYVEVLRKIDRLARPRLYDK